MGARVLHRERAEGDRETEQSPEERRDGYREETRHHDKIVRDVGFPVAAIPISGVIEILHLHTLVTRLA